MKVVLARESDPAVLQQARAALTAEVVAAGIDNGVVAAEERMDQGEVTGTTPVSRRRLVGGVVPRKRLLSLLVNSWATIQSSPPPRPVLSPVSRHACTALSLCD